MYNRKIVYIGGYGHTINYHGLTLYKSYNAIGWGKEDCWFLNDYGDNVIIPKIYFVPLDDFRNNQIDNIIC